MAFQFLEQQEELAAQLGLDESDSDQATLLKRWLNNAQAWILDAAPWPFNRASTPLIIQTVPDITTGTATVAADSTSVTLSSGPSDSVQGRFIQFEDSDDWYEITSHTGGSTSLTISPSAISAQTAGTYKIRKIYYSTDSTVDRILQITQSITPYRLVEAAQSEIAIFDTNMDSTGTPEVFAMAGVDSNGYPQFILWPAPDEEINLIIDYYKKAVALSGDTDESVIPEKYVRSVMMEGALAQGYKFLGDNRENQAQSNYLGGIERMKQEIPLSYTRERIRRAIDGKPRPRYLPLPPDFPSIFSR